MKSKLICGAHPKPTLDVNLLLIDTSPIVCREPQKHAGLHEARGDGWTWTWKRGKSKFEPSDWRWWR